MRFKFQGCKVLQLILKTPSFYLFKFQRYINGNIRFLKAFIKLTGGMMLKHGTLFAAPNPTQTTAQTIISILAVILILASLVIPGKINRKCRTRE